MGGNMLSQLFHAHGLLCASHPWEVIVFTLTLTLCTLSMGSTLTGGNLCGWNTNCPPPNEYSKNADVVIMTITRCMAVLYIYHQFQNLRKMGSKYILGIAGLFTVFSSFVFSSSVINFLQSDLTELNEALPFFLLLIDLSKASLLAQFALTSSSHKEVRDNIARGMAVLGPTITLDTLVETLVIGVGTLSGVKRLEVMCCFACLSVVVNYLVFMTFFPACLSLVLELSRDRDEGHHPVWQIKSLTRVLQEEEQKPNPVLQRVKVIMSAGLVLVHAHSRWPLYGEYDLGSAGIQPQINADGTLSASAGSKESAWWMLQLTRWLTVSLDQLIMLILAAALSVRYIFYENRDDISAHVHNMMSASSSSADVSSSAKGSESNGGSVSPSCSVRSVDTYFSSSASTATSPISVVSVGVSTNLPSPLQPRLTRRSVATVTAAVKTAEVFVQTEQGGDGRSDTTMAVCVAPKSLPEIVPPRSLELCKVVYAREGPKQLSDVELMSLVNSKVIASYQLEKLLEDNERAVSIRRRIVAQSAGFEVVRMDRLPYLNYDYSQVIGACCENVVGYMTVPVGVAGPLPMNGRHYYVPMATTEGCLVASTNRGCRALMKSGGVKCTVTSDGMTRGPVVRLSSAIRASEVMRWLKTDSNFQLIKTSFDSTSRFARLKRLKLRLVARYLFVRFEATTGDAMGMNMLSKGTEVALKKLQDFFPDIEILSLSGNYCTDKKAAAVNWIEGRGKSVVSEAIIPASVVKEVLKTTVAALVEVNVSKNLVGSAVAGSIGGFNAQAANIVTAIFIATGQDPAQNVTSSNCMTLMEPIGPDGENLYISCTMPSLEVGTVGGGTRLPAQSACLDLLGVQGSHPDDPGSNAVTLANIICGAVLAGELSLMSALSAGHLVRSHMQHNRRSSPTKEHSTATSSLRKE